MPPHPILHYLAQGPRTAMEHAICLATRVTINGNDFKVAFKEHQDLK